MFVCFYIWIWSDHPSHTIDIIDHGADHCFYLSLCMNHVLCYCCKKNWSRLEWKSYHIFSQNICIVIHSSKFLRFSITIAKPMNVCNGLTYEIWLRFMRSSKYLEFEDFLLLFTALLHPLRVLSHFRKVKPCIVVQKILVLSSHCQLVWVGYSYYINIGS